MLEDTMSRKAAFEDALSVREVAAVSPALEQYGHRRLFGDAAKKLSGRSHADYCGNDRVVHPGVFRSDRARATHGDLTEGVAAVSPGTSRNVHWNGVGHAAVFCHGHDAQLGCPSHVRTWRTQRLAHAPRWANAARDRRRRLGPGMERTEARDENGRCDLDAARREALARRDGRHQRDAYRYSGTREWQGRRLDGARHGRAVWLGAGTGIDKRRRRRCRTGTPAVSGHHAATRRVEQGRSVAPRS